MNMDIDIRIEDNIIKNRDLSIEMASIAINDIFNKDPNLKEEVDKIFIDEGEE